VKKTVYLMVTCFSALLLTACTPAQRPADEMNDRTKYPNDLIAPDNGDANGVLPYGDDDGLKRTGNRWHDWMGQDRVQPMDHNRTR